MFNQKMRRDKAHTPGLEPCLHHSNHSLQPSSSGSSLLKRVPYTIKKMSGISTTQTAKNAAVKKMSVPTFEVNLIKSAEKCCSPKSNTTNNLAKFGSYIPSSNITTKRTTPTNNHLAACSPLLVMPLMKTRTPIGAGLIGNGKSGIQTLQLPGTNSQLISMNLQQKSSVSPGAANSKL